MRMSFFAGLAAAATVPMAISSMAPHLADLPTVVQSEAMWTRLTDVVNGKKDSTVDSLRSSRDKRSAIDKTLRIPVVAMEEAFRYEITPAGILGRWPRVTTGLVKQSLRGYRVPLVSGTRIDDLSGSITYWFNSQGRCSKIEFIGRTGDARRLVELLESRFGLEQVTPIEPGTYLYQLTWSNQALSWALIRPSEIIRESEPFDRFAIELSLSALSVN